jgi:hypothetical protein
VAHHFSAARGIAGVFALLSSTAGAHQFGYHTTVDLVVRPDGMTALVTLDVPRGRESQLHRAQADRNGDRELDGDERQILKSNLVRLALKMLEVRRDGVVAPAPRVADAKMSLSQSTHVDEEPLSVAVMLEFSGGAGTVEVRDEAPDALPVPVRISFEPSSVPATEGLATRTLPVRAKPPW